MYVFSCSVLSDSATLCPIAYQGSSVHKQYWSGLLFPSPADRPDPGIKPMSPVSPNTGRRILYHCTPGKPQLYPHSPILHSKDAKGHMRS